MDYQDKYTKGKRVNYKSLLRKEEQKQKRLQKEQERLARAPSCRLSKNDKKQTARTNIILDEERIQEASSTEKPQQKRLVLRKQKRKQGHRNVNASRIEQTDHLEGFEEDKFDELSYWSNIIIWRCQEINKEEHNLTWSYQLAIDEMNERKKCNKWYAYLDHSTRRKKFNCKW